jgi:sensor histidine kinase YesM
MRQRARLSPRVVPIYQGRTQLHMLANSLSTVSALIRRRPEAAEELLAEISRVLRRLMGSPAPLIPLSDELRLTMSFVALQRARMGGRLRFEIALPREVLDLLIPTCTLQPLIENAIIHGIASRPAGGHIRVIGRIAGGMLHLAVVDNGPGLRRPLEFGCGGGWGLTGVRARLAALWSARARLRLLGRPGVGTIAAISAPIPAERTP